MGPKQRVTRKRQAEAKVTEWSTQMLKRLSPEIRQALLTKSLSDIKDVDTFILGFAAGRAFQHDRISKLLCSPCMSGVPILVISGVPIHEVLNATKDGIWRKSCDAKMIYAFKP